MATPCCHDIQQVSTSYIVIIVSYRNEIFKKYVQVFGLGTCARCYQKAIGTWYYVSCSEFLKIPARRGARGGSSSWPLEQSIERFVSELRAYQAPVAETCLALTKSNIYHISV